MLGATKGSNRDEMRMVQEAGEDALDHCDNVCKDVPTVRSGMAVMF